MMTDTGEMLMEESTGSCDTDTIPIPMLNVERKTVPVICPQCNKITGIVESDVERNMKISPVYMICGKFIHFFWRGWNHEKRST